jgi:hypothetical protein
MNSRQRQLQTGHQPRFSGTIPDRSSPGRENGDFADAGL